MAFVLSSPDIQDGQTIPMAHIANVMGCTGENLSPALSWSGAPEGTKSFALTVYDPDAPTGSGFWHWVVFNIPPSATSLPRGVTADGKGLPAGAIQSRTDAGPGGYLGPAPPPGHGAHRYIFPLYALKTETLEADADASGAYIGFNIHFAQIGSASLTGTFGR